MNISAWRYIERRPSSTAFGSLLAFALKAGGFTQSVFAGKVGITQGFLSQVCNGEKVASTKHLELWVTMLGLDGLEAQLFTDLAVICNIPAAHRGRFEELALRRAQPLATS